MSEGLVGDIESVKTAIAAELLSARFADVLAAVNAEKNDGHTTPDPALAYDHEHAQLMAYPAAEVIGANVVYDPEDDVKVGTQRVAVVWTMVGDDEALVTKDVERLVRTTRDVLWRSVLGGRLGLQAIQVESEDYSALSKTKSNAFIKGGQIVLLVTTIAN